MKKIFFQGDSITDAGRDKRDNHFLSGYSLKVKEKLGKNFEYVNYGLSGNTSRQVLERHEKEIKAEKPDYLVLMIGINDVWRHFDGHDNDAVSKEECITNISNIIKQSKKQDPSLKTIFVEPYFIAGKIPALVNATEMFESFLYEIRSHIPMLVNSYIKTYEEFLFESSNGKTVADDGVHPNDYGQEKIALKIVQEINILEKE